MTERAPPPVRPGLLLAILCAAGAAALAAPGPASAAFQARDTAPPSDTVQASVDSLPELHAATLESRLDSLRVRAARFRAAIMRLRVRHDIRVQRVESGLRFDLPYPLSGTADAPGEDVVDPVARIADLARRYYPSASIAVLGTLDGVRPPCGSETERRRAREVVDRLREGGGLDPERIRRAECVRSTVTDVDTPPGAREDSPPGATIYIEWDAPDGSS